MPRLPDHVVDGVAFLYKTVPDAEARKREGGTGFLVGRPLTGSEKLFGQIMFMPFLVSNRHVVLEGSACVATLNRKDGGPPVIWDIDQNDWHAHPEGDDIAATCVLSFVENLVHKASFLRESDFLTPAKIAEYDVGIGEDVFMVGRFINHQGQRENLPAARFGNVSVMPSPIMFEWSDGRYREQICYAVEMRSRTGFSGSPVCAFRTIGSSLKPVPETAEHFFGLLGVNCGYVFDEHKENTWLNGVVPVSRLVGLLDAPPLREVYDAELATIAALVAALDEG